MEQTEDIIGAATEAHVKWARSEAKAVWEKHGKGIIPVMPDQIIQSLGIPCREAELQMDGVAHFDENGVMFIMYKRDCTPARKRFTLAHELGHIVLEHVAMGQSSQHSTQSQEREANEFSGELLIPTKDLKDFTKKKDKTVEQVASRYDVSREAALIAVKKNGLLMRMKTVALPALV